MTTVPRERVLPLASGLALGAAALHIAAALAGWPTVPHLTMALYTPPLAWALVRLTGLRTRLSRLWLVGLAFGWLGDTFGFLGFLALLGAFLVGHLAYIAALWPHRARSVLGRPAVLAYLVALALAACVIAPAAGSLVVPVILYAALLTLMAVLATAGGPPGVIGGVAFFLSDLLIGYFAFVAPDTPGWLREALVIGLYVPAQVLLLAAALRLSRREDAEARSALQ